MPLHFRMKAVLQTKILEIGFDFSLPLRDFKVSNDLFPTVPVLQD